MINFFIPLFLIFNFHQVNEKAYNYHNKKADFYFHKGNYPEMLYHLSEKVKYDPKDVVAWCDLGYYYWSLSVNDKKRSDEFRNKAFKCLELGLNNNQESAIIYDEIGSYFLNKNKDYSQAIPYYKQATEKPDCGKITFHLLALCYEKTNNVNKAISTLQVCIKKFPNDEKAKSKLNTLKD